MNHTQKVEYNIDWKELDRVEIVSRSDLLTKASDTRLNENLDNWSAQANEFFSAIGNLFYSIARIENSIRFYLDKMEEGTILSDREISKINIKGLLPLLETKFLIKHGADEQLKNWFSGIQKILMKIIHFFDETILTQWVPLCDYPFRGIRCSDEDDLGMVTLVSPILMKKRAVACDKVFGYSITSLRLRQPKTNISFQQINVVLIVLLLI